jgi:hypothetical protein
MLARSLLCCALLACVNNRPRSGEPAAEWSGPVFRGMCDASAAVILDEDRVIVADDEDNGVRIYRRTGGEPLLVIDPSSFLELAPARPEVDLEAAVRVGDVIYWVSSHGRSSSGKPRPNRLRFFATRVVTGADGTVSLVPIGRPMPALLEALVAEPKLAAFDLARSAERPPKAEGGLSIEGLAARPDGAVLIAFRNPLPGGKALTIGLRNPDGVVQGEPPVFDDPRLLDLGGRGIRSIDRAGDRYVMGAGAFDDRRDAALYAWAGGDDVPVRIGPQDLGTFMPEAIVVDEAGRLLLFSDDGSLRVGDGECKRADPSRRSFRGMTVVP